MLFKPSGFKNKSLGVKGENQAADFLEKKSYKILHRNFRCKYGEIDIVAQKGEFLVFIEVKTRSESSQVSPLISLTSKKRNKLRQLAEFYISKFEIYDKQPRMDVIAITFSTDDNYYLELIENAF